MNKKQNKSDTKQTTLLDENGRFAKGNTPPAGFNVNPQNRHNGAWKKEDSPRFKLEKMMKLSEKELFEINNDKTAPYFERKLAKAINSGNWKEIREMIHEVYGLPKQSIATEQEIVVRGVSFIKEE